MSDTDDQGRPDDRRDPTAPPAEPYGGGSYSPPGYPQAPYGQGAGAPPPPVPGAGGPGTYPAASQPPPTGYPGYQQQQPNTGALVLTIVSGATLLFCGGLLVIPALIFGILGLTRQGSDPESSRRMTRYGWWAYVAGVVVSIIAVIVVVVVIIASSSSGSFSGY